MNPKKPIINPMLCGTIELMRNDDTAEHRKMFLDEVVKARFLCPAVINPPLKPDENGMARLTPESKVQFPMLSTPEGKQLFMAYTDMDELKKWKSEVENQPTLVLTFDDYAGMMLHQNQEGNPNPAVGVVINPYSSNIILNRELISQIAAARGVTPNK